MAAVNSRFASNSEAEILKMEEDAVPENTKKATKVLLRSLSEYILKHFTISVNILPLFTSISKNNC